MPVHNRMVFYCDQATMDRFESTLRPSQRFVPKELDDFKSILIPIDLFGLEDWPILRVKDVDTMMDT